MSIYNQNQKTEIINRSTTVLRSSVAKKQIIALPTYRGKDMVINLSIPHDSNSIIKVSFTANAIDSSNHDNEEGAFWISHGLTFTKLDGTIYQDLKIESNTVTLGKGVSQVVIPASMIQNNELANIVLKIENYDGVYVNGTLEYKDPNNRVFRLLPQNDKFQFKLERGKIYAIDVVELSDGNLNEASTMRFLSGSNNISNLASSNDSIQFLDDDIILQNAHRYYISTMSGSNSLVINKPAGYLILSISEINDIKYKTEYQHLYSTRVSIGEGMYHNIQPTTENIVIKIDIKGNGTPIEVSHNMYYVDIYGGLLEHQDFHLMGSKNYGKRHYTNMEGTFYIISSRPVNAHRLHVGSHISGDCNVTVNILGSSRDTLTNILKHEEQPINLANQIVLETNTILVQKYKEGNRHSKYENWEITLNDSIFTISDGVTLKKFDYKELPEWKENDYPAIFSFAPYKQGGPVDNFSREDSVRCCIFTVYGNVYHNYPAKDPLDKTIINDFSKFDLSAVYEPTYSDNYTKSVSSVRIPSRDRNLSTQAMKVYRYEPGLPEHRYTQHVDNIGGKDFNGIPYGNGGHPAILLRDGNWHIRMVHPVEFGSNPQGKVLPYQFGAYLGQPFAWKSKMTICAPYLGTPINRQVIYGTTDGGRTWVVLNEFGCSKTTGTAGYSLDYTTLGAYNSHELAVAKRTYNYPSENNKEPENAFTYSKAVSVSRITTTEGKTIVTTLAPHNFNSAGESYIVFKSMSTGNYSHLDNNEVCSTAKEIMTNSIGNGRFYAAKYISTNEFELLAPFAAADEYMDVWHIHSATPCKDGVMIASGEEYPNGWLTYISIPQIDDFEFYEIWKHRVGQKNLKAQQHMIRLNSSSQSAQRAVGCILRDDLDQTVIFSSDERSIDRGYVSIPGRTSEQLIKRNSGGLFTIPLRDIDDFSKAECILEVEEASLGLVEYNGIMCMLGMSKNTYINAGDKNRKDDWVIFPRRCQFTGYDERYIYLRDLVDANIYKVSKI